MTAFRVITTAKARRHLAEIVGWSLDNGVSLDRFEKALGRILALLAHHPGIGTAVPNEPGVFRFPLKRTKYQMFFRVNEKRGTVYVVAFWHTSRGEGPPL